LVGGISAGKSSLLNSLLGLKLPVGVGETTKEAKIVFKTDKIEIYDTPG
jgi:ribosome biogenesis GTPase A